MGESSSLHRTSVHQALGGGAVADVLLWKKWSGGVVVLVCSTTSWFLFERVGYNLLSFIANVLLLLVVIIFLWAKSASLLNRPLPPIPDLEISEKTVLKVADEVGKWTNHGLSIAHDIAVERNVKRFLQVSFGLWMVSYLGSLFDLLTLVYIGVLLSLLVPVLYHKYQDQIDGKLIMLYKFIETKDSKLDRNIVRKILMPLNKEKKTQ